MMTRKMDIKQKAGDKGCCLKHGASTYILYLLYFKMKFSLSFSKPRKHGMPNGPAANAKGHQT